MASWTPCWRAPTSCSVRARCMGRHHLLALQAARGLRPLCCASTHIQTHSITFPVDSSLPAAKLESILMQYKGPAQGDLRHETEGWRCLESSVRALCEIITACGPTFLPLLTRDLRQLLYRVVLHRSR